MNKKQVIKDIDGAVRVSKYGHDPYNNKSYFNKYGKIYSFNNEQINHYYKHFNYDESVLAVASSGDHMLHAILAGAKDITLFDINRLTKYFCMLKLAGIKTLKYEEFLTYFETNPGVFNLKNEILYGKVRKALLPEDKYFWDEVIKTGLSFENFYENFDSIAANNSYHDRNTYYDLQDKASRFKGPKFLESDIFSLPNKIKPNEKFSSMFLSNIADYVDDLKFEDLLANGLKEHLLEDGLIQTNYYTDYDKLGLKIVLNDDVIAVKKSI